MFVGREEELAEIKRTLETSRFEATLIYGRRRVGKTELIREALENFDKKVIQYECKQVPAKENLTVFRKVVMEAFETGLKDYSFSTYDELFDFLFSKSAETEFVLVIDEFSFLLGNKEAVDSSLAVAIDKYKSRSKMKLIISGSYVKILKEMISIENHLYGRFTHIINLKPMDYYTSSKFYPDYSNEDKVKMYAVFGGIPYFNSLIDERLSAEENIINLVVRKNSILETEIEGMVLKETNKIFEMNILIMLIASGCTKYSDMVARLSKNDMRIDYYLDKLIEMEIIERRVPINDSRNKKKTFYVFKDNLIRFYYRYIYENFSMRNVMNADMFYNLKIKDDFENNYIPNIFENIAQEYLILQNKLGRINPVILDIGSYSFDDSKNRRNVQLDVVTRDENGYISYECKYTNEAIGKRVIDEEKAQTIDLGMNIYKLGFVSKNGFKDSVDMNEYNCISLADMY